MNLQARLYLCSSCGSWVMLQIVLKRKFFIKRPLPHQLPYIKLLFKMHALYYTDVQNIQYNNRLNHYTKQRKSIFSFLTTIRGMSCLKAPMSTLKLFVCLLVYLFVCLFAGYCCFLKLWKSKYYRNNNRTLYWFIWAYLISFNTGKSETFSTYSCNRWCQLSSRNHSTTPMQMIEVFLQWFELQMSTTPMQVFVVLLLCWFELEMSTVVVLLCWL